VCCPRRRPDPARRALADKLFGRRVALVGGFCLALSPFIVNWSQQARGYTLGVAVCSPRQLLLLRALERQSRCACGFGEHRLVERMQFGWRVTAELWKR
jgi:hypothetical protein